MTSPSTAQSPRPPLSEARYLRWSWYCAVIAAVGVGAGQLLDNDIIFGICLGLAIVAFLFVFITYFRLRWLRKILDAMVGGDFIAHWVYSPEEWSAHLFKGKKHWRSEMPRYLSMGLIFGFVLAALIVLLAVFADGRSWASMWPIGAIAMGAMLGLFLFCGAIWEFFQFMRYREIRRIGGEVYLASSGLYYSGTIYLSRLEFVSVRYAPLPDALLIFEFRIRMKGNQSYIETIGVPVPPGREAMAPQLVQLIRGTW